MSHLGSNAANTPLANSSVAYLVNANASTAVFGTPVYSSAPGAFDLALGNGSARAVLAGIVVNNAILSGALGYVLTDGIVNGTTAQWDAVCGTTGGLAFGVTYYLSTTVPGALTTSSASNVAVLIGWSPTIALIKTGSSAGSGISGLTATKLPVATSGTTIADSTIADTAAATVITKADASGTGIHSTLKLVDPSLGGVGSTADGVAVQLNPGNSVDTYNIQLAAVTTAPSPSFANPKFAVLVQNANTTGVGNTTSQLEVNNAGVLVPGTLVVQGASSLQGTVSANSVGVAALSSSGDVVFGANATFAQVASPTTPPAGKINLYAAAKGGRSFATFKDANGIESKLQPAIGHKRIAYATVIPQTTTLSIEGMTVGNSAAAFTARIPTATNMANAAPRLGYASAATAASVAGFSDNNANAYWRGNAAGLGGFYFVCRFVVADASLVSTAQMFIGFRPSAGLSATNPSTYTNCIGVGCDSGDTVLQIYASGSSAQARISLGANFPVNTTLADLYEVVFFAPPNSATIGYTVTRLNTGDVASGTVSLSASLFSNTTFVAPIFSRGNGATAAATTLDLVSMYIESET